MTNYDKLAADLPDVAEQPPAAPVLYTVADTDPDAEAGLRTLSKSTGIPVEALRLKPQADEARRIDAANKHDGILNASPKTAGFLQDPIAAAVSHDDVENMGFMERIISGLDDLSFRATVAQDKNRQGKAGYVDKLFAGGVKPLVTEQDFKERADKMFASGLFPTQQEAADAVRRQIKGFVRPGDAAMSPGRAGQATPGAIGDWLGNIIPSSIGQAWSGISQTVADLTGLDQAAAQIAREQEKSRAQDALMRPDFGGETANAVASGVESTAQQLPGLATSYMTGGTAPGLAYIGAMVYGPAYSKYRGRGASTGMAILGAGGETVTEVLTEKIPMGETLRALESATGGRWKQAATRYLSASMSEVKGEQAATLIQDAIDTAVANPNKTWAEYIAERPDASYQTLVATLTQTALMAGAGGAARVAGQFGYTPPEQKQLRSEASAQLIEQLNKGAAASKVLARDPETFQSFIKSAAEGGPVTDVYIDANVLNQSGLAEQVLAASPAAAEQYQEALATGGQVRIPIDEYAARIAPQEYAQQLLDDLRLQPEDMSRREAQEYAQSGAMQDLEAAVAAVVGNKTQDDTFAASRDRVKQQVLDNLNALGRFTPQKNELDATLIAARSATRAAQLGVTPEQFFNDYLLKVTAEGVGGEVLSQEDGAADLYVGHNLTAEKLRYAFDLGGLPAPSLGISRTTTGGFDGYGDITLLAPKEVLESSGARTFNADVYSPRQPKPVYKPNQKAFDDLITRLRAMPGGFSVADIDEVGRYGAEALARSDAVKMLYLTETGQAPKAKQQKVPAEIKKAAKVGPKYAYSLREDPTVQKLAAKHYQDILAQYQGAGIPEADINRIRSRYFDENGELTLGMLTEFSRKVERYIADGGIDTGALRLDIAKKLRTEAQSDAFGKWVKDMSAAMLGDKKLELSPSRRVPYTLDNVTAQMIKDLRGGEGFNYGAGSIRAMFAAEMRSVKEIQNRRDEVVSGEDMKKAKEGSQQRLTEVLDALKPFYKYDANGWGYMADATRAIGEGEKGWREAFRLTAESKKILSDYVSYLKNLPTEYFETKMQRSMDLSEFAVAIVPTGTPSDVISALEAKGLKIKTYNKNKPESRIKAIASAGAENGVLFQTAQPFTAPTIEIDGITRPTTNSAGNPIHSTESGIRNFWKWFGDSKIVDEQGRPLVVYHGSRSADALTEFVVSQNEPSDTRLKRTKDGAYFTRNPDKAAVYAGQDGSTYPVYLKISNPKMIADAFGSVEVDAAQLRAEGFDGLWNPKGFPSDEIVAIDKNQIKSAVANSGGFSPKSDNILYQSDARPSSPIPRAVAESAGIDNAYSIAESEKFEYIRDLKVRIQKAVLDAAGSTNLEAMTQDVKDYLVGIGVNEGMKALDSNANAVGWYDTKTRQALAVVGLVHPEILTDEDSRFAFIYALAVTSNGQKVAKNFELAERAYSVWKQDGKMPEDVGAGGPARKKVHEGLAKYNTLIEKFGSARAAAEFMLTEFTVKEMESAGFKVSGELKTETVLGAAILGPKIGNGFFANLYGVFDQLTMDRWLMRTWGRWTGSLLSKNEEAIADEGKVLAAIVKGVRADKPALKAAREAFAMSASGKINKEKMKDFDDLAKAKNWEHLAEQIKLKSTYPAVRASLMSTPLTDQLRLSGNRLAGKLDGQNEAPNGGKHRAWIRSVFSDVLSTVNDKSGVELTMADLQALLWYPEKRLYDSAKSDETLEGYGDDEAPDYANAAASLARGRGIAEEAIAAALARPADRSGVVRRRRDDAGAVQPGNKQTEGNNGRPQEVGGNSLLQPDTLNQVKRGSFSPATNTIALLKNADLSTFLHETGHFFFETDIAIAGQILRENGAFGIDTMTPGQQQILRDVSALLKWHGIEGDIASQIDQWDRMDFEERRGYHEKTAESFERYLMEGKAPSIELQQMFQSFRQWLLSVYKSLKAFLVRNPDAGELSDEVRAVFDRMLATEEEIKLAEQARSMIPLFADAVNAGMTPSEFAEYQKLGNEATRAAIDELQAKGVRDMKWLSNARSRMLKKLQAQAKAQRAEVRARVRMEVMEEPVYQAWNLLTAKMTAEDQIGASKPKRSVSVDPTSDSLFEAIAKMGGLNKAALVSQWGIDPKDKADSGLFGKPVMRAKDGGASLDAMVEALTEEGYLTPDENGKGDVAELEEKFQAELRGDKQYSRIKDYEPDALAGQGEDVAGVTAARIDRASLDDMEGLSSWIIGRLEVLGMTARTGGMHPDVLSEVMPGWTSGDELVRAIVAARPLKEEIEARTDQRMIEQYSELATPEALEQAADMAIHNDARERFLATEYNALAKATGEHKMLLDAARGFARQLIGRQRIRDIRPGQYTAAETRAAKAAMTAKDVAQKAAEKRNQILSGMAAREAYRAKEDVDKGLRYLKKFESPTIRKRISGDYVDQIEKLLEAIDLRKRSLTDIDRRKSFGAFVRSQIEKGIVPVMSDSLLPPNLRAAYVAKVMERNADGELIIKDDVEQAKVLADFLDMAETRPYKEMTVEEFRGLIDTIRQIEHLGRKNKSLLTARDGKTYEQKRDELAASVAANSEKLPSRLNRTIPSKMAERLSSLRDFKMSLRKVGMLMRLLDGNKDGGPMWDFFVRSANERGDWETEEIAKSSEVLTKALRPLFKMKGKMRGKGVYFESLGRSLNREQRIGLALNVGNEGNLQRLLDGEGWTYADIKPVLESLTEAEWVAVQEVWDHMDSYRPMIAAIEKRTVGAEPEWVQPMQFMVQTADGKTLTLKGGYYPVKYDTEASARSEQLQDATDAKAAMDAAYGSSTTHRSFVKKRSEMVVGRPLELSLSGMYSGVQDVIHDLAWREWLLDASKMAESKTLDAVIRDKHGAETVRAIKDWIKDIAAGTKKPRGKMDRAIGFMRRNVAAAGLAINFMNAVQNVTGIQNSIERVGAKWIAVGQKEFLSDIKGASAWVSEKSSLMRNRARTQFRDLNELRNIVENGDGIVTKARANQFILMTTTQRIVDMPTWIGAYRKAEADGAVVQYEDGSIDDSKAIAMADQAVIDAQGSGMTKDLSGIERGSEAEKLFTVYYSYMNTTYNLGASRIAGARGGNAKERGSAAFHVLTLMMVPVIAMAILKATLTPGDDDDWDDPEKLAKNLGNSQMSYLFGMVPLLREFYPMVQPFVADQSFGYQGPSGMRMASDAAKFGQQAAQGDFDDGFRKAAVSLSGPLMGMPAAQINRTWTGVEAIADDKTVNPAALLFGYQEPR